MRLNRGTIALLLISIVVIGAVLFLNSEQANAPEEPTDTPNENAGPLFAGVAQENVVSLTVVNNLSGEVTTLMKDDDDIWSVEATNSRDFEVDQVSAVGSMGVFADLEASDSFEVEGDSLGDFGLDIPSHTITMTTSDDGEYTAYIGSTNPTNTRRYIVLAVTPGTGEPPVEATDEATSEAAGDDADEPTEEATDESAVKPGDVTLAKRMPPAQDDAPDESADEPTEEATAEATPETLVTLTGTQTVYLVPQDSIGALLQLVAQPPYIIPTPTPTPSVTPNPLSEVDMTATAAAQQTATMSALATPEATAESTADATTEVTETP